MSDGTDELDAVREITAKIRELEAAHSVAEPLRQKYIDRKEAIEREMREDEALQLADAKEAEIEEELKALCIENHMSVKGDSLQCVYTPGRVKWDAKALDRFAQANPQIREFRTVGADSAYVRGVAKKGAES